MESYLRWERLYNPLCQVYYVKWCWRTGREYGDDNGDVDGLGMLGSDSALAEFDIDGVSRDTHHG